MASITSIESMVSTLFTAPGNAAVEAERAYRQIWISWLKDLAALVKARNFQAGEADMMVKEHAKLAPIMRIGGNIDIGITMRIASVSEKQGSISLNLGVGPIGASGSFGFMNRTSEESVLQVHAQYAIANTEIGLEEFLKDSKLTLASPADVDTAIKFLETKSN
jgi:hypothetical protein